MNAIAIDFCLDAFVVLLNDGNWVLDIFTDTPKQVLDKLINTGWVERKYVAGKAFIRLTELGRRDV